MALLDFSQFAEPAGGGADQPAAGKPVTSGGVDFSQHAEPAKAAVPTPPPRPVISGGVDFSARAEPLSLYNNPMSSHAPGGENTRVPTAASPEHQIEGGITGEYFAKAANDLQKNFEYGTPQYAAGAAVATIVGAGVITWDAIGRVIGAGTDVAAGGLRDLTQAVYDKWPELKNNGYVGTPDQAAAEVSNFVNFALIDAGMKPVGEATGSARGVRPDIRQLVLESKEAPPPPAKPKGPIANYTEAMGYPALPAPGAEAVRAAPAPDAVSMPPSAPPEQAANKPVQNVQSGAPPSPPPVAQPPAPAISPSLEAGAPAAEAKPMVTLAPVARPALPAPQPALINGAEPAAMKFRGVVFQGQDHSAALDEAIKHFGQETIDNNSDALIFGSMKNGQFVPHTGSVNAPGSLHERFNRPRLGAAPPPVIAMPGPKEGAQPGAIQSYHATAAEPHAVAEPARVQQELADPQVAAYLKRPFNVDDTTDVPYGAGYTKDGTAILIDRHMPKTLPLGPGGEQVPILEFLTEHENVEKTLIDIKGYKYQGAHEIATGAEHALLRSKGYDPALYEKLLQPHLKHDEHEQLTAVNPAIDLTPYNDTQAKNIEARMAAAEQGQVAAIGAEPVKPTGTIAPKTKASEPATPPSEVQPPPVTQTTPKKVTGQIPQIPAAPEKPVSLVRFLKSQGGIKDESGELKGVRQSFSGLVNNKLGMSHDRAREVAAEAGYFDHLYGTPERAMAESTPADLRALLPNADKAFPRVGLEKAAAEPRQPKPSGIAAARKQIEAALVAGGAKKPPADLVEHAAAILAERGNGDPEGAIEAAIYEIEAYTLTPARTEALNDALPPGWEDDAHAIEPPESGERAPENGAKAQEPAGSGRPEASGGPPPDRGPPAVEKNEAGQQGVIPGAERIGQGELAKRKAAEPLKPKVAQKPADQGLFGDEKDQTDLLDELASKRGQTFHDFLKSEEGSLNLNRILRRAANGEETPPLTRAQARERKKAEKEFPYKQRIALDKTQRQLAAQAEDVRQMGDAFIKALKGAGYRTKGLIPSSLRTMKNVLDREKLFALHQKITKYQENVLHPTNQPKLTPGEMKLYNDFYKPLFDLHAEKYAAMMQFKHLMSDEQRAEFEGAANPEYVHHVVAGKASKYDRIARETGYGPILGRGNTGGTNKRALPISAAAAKASSYYAAENDRTGKTVILSQGEEGATNRWQDGKSTAGPKVKVEIGNGFTTKNGDHWTIRRAKLAEKMGTVPHDYYQNIYATTADSILALEHAKLGLEYFDQLTKTPQWAKMATRSTDHEDGWKQIDRAPLHGWYLHPDLYAPLIDFYGGEKIINLGRFLEGLNRLATQSIFISPIPHAWNVYNHAFVERGWDWLSAPGYVRLAITGAQAIRDVKEMRPAYIEGLRDGEPLFYSSSRNNNLIQHLYDRLGAEIEAEKEGGFWHQVAKVFNYPSPLALIPYIYRAVGNMMWFLSDIPMRQRVRELQWKAMRGPLTYKRLSQVEAIHRARQHIPDYVVPPKVLGSRLLSQVLQDHMLTMFGRYRFSQWKTYFHDVHEMISGDNSIADKGAAFGRLLAAFIMYTTIYSLLDEYLQKLLRIPDAKVVRGGPFHLLENAQILAKQGITGLPRFVYTTFIPSPVISAGVQFVLNHELWKEAFGFRDPPILQKGQSIPQGIAAEAKAQAESIGIGSDIMRALHGQAGPVLGQQLGVKLPSNHRPAH